jgi:hypothetical protein
MAGTKNAFRILMGNLLKNGHLEDRKGHGTMPLKWILGDISCEDWEVDGTKSESSIVAVLVLSILNLGVVLLPY